MAGNIFETIGDILNAPLPGTAPKSKETKPPAPVKTRRESADEDTDTVFEKIIEALNKPLPGTSDKTETDEEARDLPKEIKDVEDAYEAKEVNDWEEEDEEDREDKKAGQAA